MSNRRGWDTWAILPREKETKRRLCCSLRLPEEGKCRGRCWSLLPRHRTQDTWEQHKAVPGESQTGCSDKFIYCEGGQTPDRLPREAVNAPCLSGPKRQLDNALSNTLVLLVSPGVVRQWDLEIFVGPFQLSYTNSSSVKDSKKTKLKGHLAACGRCDQLNTGAT